MIDSKLIDSRLSGASSDLTKPYLFVVEDSDEDFEVLQRILRRSYDFEILIRRCLDGDEALDFLHREGGYTQLESCWLPSLVLLDLNLPGSDGREVLRSIKQDERLKVIPVVIFTTSSNPKDIETCYQYGANSYLIKPMNTQQLKTSVRLFFDYWFKATQLPSVSYKSLKP